MVVGAVGPGGLGGPVVVVGSGPVELGDGGSGAGAVGATDCGVKGLFCDFSDLLERIQATFSRTNQDSADDVLAPYRDADLLVLDELGARRPSDWVRDVLYGLINTRYNRQRLTIVTSNYSDTPARTGEENLEIRIGAMVRSRLYEMCDLVVLDGLDYRAWRSVKVLSQLRDLDSCPTLIQALDDPDWEVVLAAEEGLQFMGYKTTAASLLSQ